MWTDWSYTEEEYMRAYRPRRDLMHRAIELVRNDPERGEKAVPHGEDGITPDAAMILLFIVNKRRDKLDERGESYDLRELVTWFCDSLPFPEVNKRYGYELVLMSYYRLLSQFKAERLRRRKQRLEARTEGEIGAGV